jgi:hypothetical protein
VDREKQWDDECGVAHRGTASGLDGRGGATEAGADPADPPRDCELADFDNDTEPNQAVPSPTVPRVQQFGRIVAERAPSNPR